MSESLNFVQNDWTMNINFVKKEMAGLMELKNSPASCCHSLAKVLDEKEENIDMTEACCESAAFKIHGRLAGEDRALSCLSFYASYYSHLMQFVVAFVFCWVSLALLLSHLSHLSCVSAGISSQGIIEGGDRALFCFPLLILRGHSFQHAAVPVCLQSRF